MTVSLSTAPTVEGVLTRRRRSVRDRYSTREVLAAVGFLVPALVIVGVFVVYPIVSGGYLSLTSWDGFGTVQQFVGLDNYRRMLADGEFWNSALVTVIYAAGVSVLSVVSGLVIALLLDAPLRGLSIYRGIYFLPVVTSSVAAAIVWRYMLDPSGVINQILDAIGLPTVDWLNQRWTALGALTLLTVWKNLGFNAILYLTALQALPVSLTQAAQLDGASLWQRIRWMTVPLLRPMTFFVVVQALITAFQSFDLVYVLTGGGPTGGTEVLGMLMYRYAFKLGQFGYGAAIAFTTLVLVLGVTLVQWKASGSGESDLA